MDLPKEVIDALKKKLGLPDDLDLVSIPLSKDGIKKLIDMIMSPTTEEGSEDQPETVQQG